MIFKKIISIFLLFLGMSISVSALGLWEKIRKPYPDAAAEEKLPSVEKEALTPGISARAEPDNLVFFLEDTTGHENIVQVYGVTEIEKLRNLQRLANTGETDAAGRQYFVYSPELRQGPVSMSDRRMDIQFYIARLSRELKRVYTADIELAVRRSFIARKEEAVISYVVDRGNDNYQYGVLYIISAVPVVDHQTENLYNSLVRKSQLSNKFNN